MTKSASTAAAEYNELSAAPGYEEPPLSGTDASEHLAIVIVGAGNPVAALVAHAVVRAGGQVALLDEDAGMISRTALALGSAAVSIRTDVHDPGQLHRALDDAERALGGLDGAVCAPGCRALDSAYRGSRDWIRQVDTCTTGIVRAAREVGRRLIRNDAAGSIVMTATTPARVVTAAPHSSTTSRSNLSAVTRALASEWAPFGVRINTITPGYQAPLTREALAAAGTAPSEAIVQVYLGLLAASSPVTGHDIAVGGLASTKTVTIPESGDCGPRAPRLHAVHGNVPAGLPAS